MIQRTKEAFNRRASRWFIVLSLVLFLGGLISGFLYLYLNIKPEPAPQQPPIEMDAQRAVP